MGQQDVLLGLVAVCVSISCLSCMPCLLVQVPSWLDIHNPRVKIVPHSSIFEHPADLPTFNSVAIQANIANIPGQQQPFPCACQPLPRCQHTGCYIMCCPTPFTQPKILNPHACCLQVCRRHLSCWMTIFS